MMADDQKKVHSSPFEGSTEGSSLFSALLLMRPRSLPLLSMSEALLLSALSSEPLAFASLSTNCESVLARR